MRIKSELSPFKIKKGIFSLFLLFLFLLFLFVLLCLNVFESEGSVSISGAFMKKEKTCSDGIKASVVLDGAVLWDAFLNNPREKKLIFEERSTSPTGAIVQVKSNSFFGFQSRPW